MRLRNDKAGAVEVTRALLRAKLRWRNPIYLSHALTSRCNARCGFCAWNFYEQDSDLTTEEVKKLYSDARRAGFLALSIWGGEPLVRKDVGEIFHHAYQLGFTTNIVTNGVLLERKMDQVVPFIDRISVSVDHASELHDELRGVPGLYQRIVDATRAIRRRDPNKKIVFICTLQKANVDRESVLGMAELIRSLGVVGVFNGMRLEAAADNAEEIDLERYNPTQAQLAEAFTLVRQLKEQGYPVVNSFTHLDKMRSGPPHYHCHWPKFMLPVEANGDIVDCMHWGTRPIGNIRETEFAELLKSPRLRALAGKEGEQCHRCVSLHRVEISEVWAGNLEPLRSWWGNLGSPRPTAAPPRLALPARFARRLRPRTTIQRPIEP
ncbi:MAG: radical SAM protein [Deltaproteobacteria bacterium]|nr:radical SAM protein [Deltaproteobacteria bacterium]